LLTAASGYLPSFFEFPFFAHVTSETGQRQELFQVLTTTSRCASYEQVEDLLASRPFLCFV